MSAYRQSIRVIYPQDGARIALRTDENWDVDLGAVSRRGGTTKFQVETDRPYFYFKPVLIRDGPTVWSRGENYLAVATSGAPVAAAVSRDLSRISNLVNLRENLSCADFRQNICARGAFQLLGELHRFSSIGLFSCAKKLAAAWNIDAAMPEF